MRHYFETPALEAHAVKDGEHFTNELGNSIRLQVEIRPIDGTQASTGKKMHNLPGVLISLEGPSSLSENHITRVEAQKLYEHLGRALGHS